MKKFNLAIILMLGIGITIFAQKDDSSNRRSKNNRTDSGSQIQSETNLSAQLQGSLDVKKSKVGDQVVLKTANAVRQNGRTVIPKGAGIIGRITEVQQKSKNNAASKISVVFERLQGKNLDTPITVSIVSITQAAGNTGFDNEADGDLRVASSASGNASGGGSSSGGLLGGIGSTVGGAANAVGGIANTAGQTVSGATNAVGKTVNGIRISQSLDVSAHGATTLSSDSNNLKLEKGLTFNLRLSEQAGN